MNKQMPILKYVLAGLLLTAVLFLLWTIVVPTGQVTYVQDFQGDNYQRLGKLKPLERTLPPTATGQTILGGPIYFALNQPRKFQQAKVNIVYRTNPNFNHSQIELGVLNNKALWQYQLQPVENTTLEKLGKSWFSLREGDEILLQKQAKYKTIAEFKQNPPAFEQIATYNQDWQLEKNYAMPEPGISVIDLSLAGGYQFLTLVGDGKLKVNFNFQKNPVVTDEDQQTEVQIFQGKDLIQVKKLEAERSVGKEIGQWSYELQNDKMKPGYYKVVLRADSNLVTNKITVNQNNFSFVGRMKFSPLQKMPLDFWTDSRELNLLARTSESVGDLYLNDKRQLIFETYKQYSFRTKTRNTKVRLTKPGLELAGDGVFALAENELFNPRLKQIDSLTDVEQEKIEYILAKYQEVQKDGDWRQASVHFDLTRAALDQGSYNFVLSVPGFKSDDDQADWLEIKSLEVELSGDNLWQEMKTFVKKALRRLFFS